MKTTAEVLSTRSSEDETPESSGLARYLLAVILLAVVYIISSWTPAESETTSLPILSAFLVFWIGGGITTLALLAMAARKNS